MLAAFGLAACGGGGGSTATAPTAPATPPVATEPTAEETEPTAEEIAEQANNAAIAAALGAREQGEPPWRRLAWPLRTPRNIPQ